MHQQKGNIFYFWLLENYKCILKGTDVGILWLDMVEEIKVPVENTDQYPATRLAQVPTFFLNLEIYVIALWNVHFLEIQKWYFAVMFYVQ